MKPFAVYCWWHFEDTCSCSWVDWKTIKLGIFLDVVYVPQSVVSNFIGNQISTSKTKQNKQTKTVQQLNFEYLRQRKKNSTIANLIPGFSEVQRIPIYYLNSWTKCYSHCFYKLEMAAFLVRYGICTLVDIICSLYLKTLKLLETFPQ